MTPSTLLADAPVLDAQTVTPGLAGFLVFFLLALFCWFLFRSFAKRVRRVNMRAAQEARLEAEQRGETPDGAGDTTNGSGPGTDRG